MANSGRRGLMGQLYYALRDLNINMNTTEGFLMFLAEKEDNETDRTSFFYSSTLWSNIVRYDYFSAEIYSQIFEGLCCENDYINRIRTRIGNLSSNQRQELSSKLITFLDSTKEYGSRRSNRGITETENYDENIKNELKDHYFKSERNRSSGFSQHTLEYNIYLYIYLSVCKRLPSNFSFGAKYRADLDKFCQKVLCKYGVTSRPGIRAMIELANEGNMFALYEYADMYYYGNTEHPIPDYNKAIELYRKAGGLDKKENVDETKCNPLALWSLSFIYYNYRRRLELKDVGNVAELDRLSPDERVEFAIDYAKKALELMESGCVYNILGIIAQNADPNICDRKNLRDPIDYFKDAAKHDYIYAYVNIALIEKEFIFTEPEKATEHLTQYVKNLETARKKHENWAANQLGLFYLNGQIESNKSSNQRVFQEYIDREKALSCFQCATKYTLDRNSAWAIANMIIYFPSVYKNNKQLLLDHIDIIFKKDNIHAQRFLKEHVNNIPEYKSGITSEVIEGLRSR